MNPRVEIFFGREMTFTGIEPAASSTEKNEASTTNLLIAGEKIQELSRRRYVPRVEVAVGLRHRIQHLNVGISILELGSAVGFSKTRSSRPDRGR